jgi:hypothetical protein
MFARRLLVSLLLLVGLAVPAFADGLFKPLTGGLSGAAAAASSPGFGVVRSRDVDLDSAYLAANIAPVGVDNAADRLALAPPPKTISIELFTGFTVELNRTSFTEAFGGGFVWVGESPRNKEDYANLVIRNGLITGTVNFGGKLYRIDPLKVAEAHRISELDQSVVPEDQPIVVPGVAEKASKAPGDKVQAVTEITVLMPYTAAAQASVADIIATANLGVSRSNSGYQRSNVEINLRLVGTMLVANYNELEAGKTYNSVLDEITQGTTTGPFQPVHAQRDALGADLVALLFNRTEFCGLAWQPGTPSAQTANLGVSVNTATCIPFDVIAHELGHNMGLDHDRFVMPAAPNTTYNFGFVSLPGQFRDIMSYNNQCAQANPVVNCQQINNFSNPNVTFNNLPTGIPAGTDGAADSARRLTETKDAVGAYRATVAQPVSLLSAVTPVARATAVNGTVTAFATIINTGTQAGTGCSIALPAGTQDVTFSYSGRNPGTGAPENPDTPVGIPAGGAYNFVMSFTPTAAQTTNIALVFSCTNSAAAPSTTGLNTFLLTATAGAPADLVSIAVTATNDGIANVPLGGTGFAALAAINIGTTANLQARLDANAIGVTGKTLAAALSMCQTNSTTGACLAPPSATVDFTLNNQQTVTFSAFITSNGTPITFDPANTRLFVHFFQGNDPVGSASVAVRTTAAAKPSLALAD